MQVQPSRVSARIAALTVVALALALTQPPATPSDDEGRAGPAETTASHERTARRAAKRNARRFQPTPIVARCRRNPRSSRANRPRQMERMGTTGLQNRKASTMERTRRIRVDRASGSITHRLARACHAMHGLTGMFSEQLVIPDWLVLLQLSPWLQGRTFGSPGGQHFLAPLIFKFPG